MQTVDFVWLFGLEMKQSSMILKLGIKHQAMELCTNCINHDPAMTLTYFTVARSS